MCWQAEKDHFKNQHVASLLAVSPEQLPQLWAPHPHAQMLNPTLTGLLTDKLLHSAPSPSFKFTKQPGLPLLCSSFSWQRETSKCLPKPDVAYLNLLILAMFVSGLKSTSYSHPAISLLSFIPSLALPLISIYNNVLGYFCQGCVLATSSPSHRREGRQNQTCHIIILL